MIPNTITLLLVLCSVCALAEYRSYSGLNNNVANPTWGAMSTAFQRVSTTGQPIAYNYADGYYAIRSDLPDARNISNLIGGVKPAQPFSVLGKNLIHIGWGLINMHDISRGVTSGGDRYVYKFPDDPLFNPGWKLNTTQTLNRARYQLGTGPNSTSDPKVPARHYMSANNFLDLSLLYGLSDDGVYVLRNTTDPAKLNYRMDPEFGMLLPTTASGTFVIGTTALVPAADAIYTIFLRMHNSFVDKFDEETNGTLSREELYQRARKWVIAYYQWITFNEYFPATASVPPPTYNGYDPTVNPTSNVLFWGGVVRYGHSEITTNLPRLDENWQPSTEGEVISRDIFRKPWLYWDAGVEPILRGAASALEMEVDNFYADDMRGYTFGLPQSGTATEAMVATILRGRDLGFPSYNDIRVAYGLTRKTMWSEFTSNTVLQNNLASLYKSVDDVDFMIGAFLEDHEGQHMGETLTLLYNDQLIRSRDGDRFWYRNQNVSGFTDAEIAEIESVKLADLIMRYTNIDKFQCAALYVSAQLDCNKNGVIPSNPTGDANSVSLLGGNYKVSWAVNETTGKIVITASAHTTGWVGFGLAKTPGRMIGSDITAGWVTASGTTLNDYTANVKEPCPASGNAGVCPDAVQNVRLISGVEQDGWTTLVFERSLVAEDPADFDFKKGEVAVVFAYGLEDGPLYYHGLNKGASFITFYGEPTTPCEQHTETTSSASTISSLVAMLVVSFVLAFLL